MSNFVVGLTGGIGSGKSTVTEFFIQLGVNVVDADIVARDVVSPDSPALSAISQHFGKAYIQTDGQLNRALLRTRIFSNETDKLWLNNLLHPLIRLHLTKQVNAAKSQYCLLVAPLLIENKLNHLVNKVLVVDVSESTQLQRTLARDNSSAAEIKSIIASQCSRSHRNSFADDIIYNDTNKNTNSDTSNLEQIKERVNTLHLQYLTLSTLN
ncbi:MAG: dephospho-CoA kinase [Colwellia sp.]